MLRLTLILTSLILTISCSPSDKNDKSFMDLANKIYWEKDIEKRLTSEKWTPPEGWEFIKDHVKELTWLNPGSLEFDPATVMNHKIFEERTGIKIVPSVVSDGGEYAKEVSMFTGKSGAYDLVHIFPKATLDFYRAGWIEDVSFLWPESAKKMYSPAAINLAAYGNKMYSVPVFGRLAIIVYRKDLFQKHLGHTNPPKSWQELFDFAKKLTIDENDDKITDTWGFAYYAGSTDARSTIDQLHSLIFSQGINPNSLLNSDGVPNYTSQEAIRALEFLIELVKQHVTPSGVVSYVDTDLYRLFKSGKIAIMTNNSWVMYKLAEEMDSSQWEAAYFPACGNWKGGPEGEISPRLDIQYAGINVFTDPYKKVASALYLDYIRSFEAYKNEQTIEQNQIFMPRVYTDSAVKQKTIKFDLIKEGVENGTDLVFHQNYPVAEIVTRYVTAAISGQYSAKEALTKAQVEIDELYVKQ